MRPAPLPPYALEESGIGSNSQARPQRLRALQELQTNCAIRNLRKTPGEVMTKRLFSRRHSPQPYPDQLVRRTSSCTDAALTLLHDVTLAHRANLKCGILLFDIKGFFDNVNHNRLVL